VNVGGTTLGRVDSGINCNVEGCSEPAVRSISADKVRAAGLRVGSERRAYLCKEHYKSMKKLTKKDREIEMMRYKP